MQNLFRLANIVGLDTTNAQHSVALEEAMFGITDQEAFLEYCRDHKNEITTYGKIEKPERLDTLSTRYKKLQDQALLPYEDAELSARTLSALFLNVRMYLKNEIEIGRDPKLKMIRLGGDPYFTDKQAEAIDQIGRLAHIIELSETNELTEALRQLYLSKYIKESRYDALTTGQQKVAGLIGRTL